MEVKMATKQVKQQGPSAGVPKTDVGERGAMQIVKTLDSMIAALEGLGLEPSTAKEVRQNINRGNRSA